jgi:hypothetical protein
MARLKEDTKTLIADLSARLAKLVEVAKKEGRESALTEVRALVGGAVNIGGGARRGRKPAAEKAEKPAKAKRKGKRKNPWAGLSPEARLARVNAIRKGRGLPLIEK